MIQISKILAEDLVSILDLFETEDEEKEFFDRIEGENVTYTIQVEELAQKYGDDMQPIDEEEPYTQNTIYECCNGSSNDVFYNVYLSKKNVHDLIQVGEIETDFLEGYISFSDATKLLGLADRTLRKAVETGKLLEGVDCLKMGRDWIVSISALHREYEKRED